MLLPWYTCTCIFPKCYWRHKKYVSVIEGHSYCLWKFGCRSIGFDTKVNGSVVIQCIWRSWIIMTGLNKSLYLKENWQIFIRKCIKRNWGQAIIEWIKWLAIITSPTFNGYTIFVFVASRECIQVACSITVIQSLTCIHLFSTRNVIQISSYEI